MTGGRLTGLVNFTGFIVCILLLQSNTTYFCETSNKKCYTFQHQLYINIRSFIQSVPGGNVKTSSFDSLDNSK
jgi:hypothetical protein